MTATATQIAKIAERLSAIEEDIMAFVPREYDHPHDPQTEPPNDRVLWIGAVNQTNEALGAVMMLADHLG